MHTTMTAGICLSMSGCAYVDPYILPSISTQCGSADKSASCTDLRGVSVAVNRIAESASQLERKINGFGSTTQVSRALGLATFGLVTALAVKTAQGGSSNSIRNLGLGAGAAYAGSTLFFAQSTESLYLTAHASLICLAGRGNSLMAVYTTARQEFDALEGKMAALQIAGAVPCDSNKQQDVKEAISAVRTARNQASAALSRVRSLDASAGTRLATAADNLLNELNRQMLKQSPSIESIEKAGRSMTAMLSAPVAGTSADANHSARSIAVSPAECTPEVTRENLAEIQSIYEGIKDSLNSQINAIGELTSGCNQPEAIPSVPLVASQSVVDLIPNSAVNIVISGGRPPYTFSWEGVEPNDKAPLSAELSGLTGILRVAEPSTGTVGSYKIHVKDAAVVPGIIKVTVNTHPNP